MTYTDDRDHAEETYWASFCDACGTSPCESPDHHARERACACYGAVGEGFARDACPVHGAGEDETLNATIANLIRSACEHEHVQQLSNHDVRCLDCGMVSA